MKLLRNKRVDTFYTFLCTLHPTEFSKTRVVAGCLEYQALYD